MSHLAMSQSLLEQVAVDSGSADVAPVLADLQGNILREHGRTHSRHVFLRFEPSQAEAAAVWVRSLQLTSTADQLAPDRGDSIFRGFSLSARGYEYFGYQDTAPGDEVFLVSMKQVDLTQIGLPMSTGDPPVERWQAPYQETVHAVLLLADDDLSTLDAELAEVRRATESFATLLTVEEGYRLVNDDGIPLEPFGFVDGISQPLFFRDEKEEYYNVHSGRDRWDPYAPLSLVLVKDPNSGASAFGSYLVWRKLEQDVAGFERGVAALAETLGTSTDLAGALVVGRFKDGTPVTLFDQAQGGPGDNNFNFEHDSQGSRCPFHSHIRKTNPRGDTTRLLASPEDLEKERAHRIVRRPEPFGVGPGEEAKTQGLLFLCYQADLSNQFVFQQAAWSNDPHFVRNDVGPDTLIGQSGAVDQDWPTTWGNPTQTASFALARYVAFRGGEYFFTPSISFLRAIAAGS